MSRGARKRANKARRLVEERARLELEQAQFDLLKAPSTIDNHDPKLSKERVSGIKLETGIKEETTDGQLPSNTKPEEFDPSLAQPSELGVKRERDEDSNTHNPAKRIKVEA